MHQPQKTPRCAHVVSERCSVVLKNAAVASMDMLSYVDYAFLREENLLLGPA